MTDLIPFIEKLSEENQLLYEQLEHLKAQSRLVEITGPRGFPVYSSVPFGDKDNRYGFDRKSDWTGYLQEHDDFCLLHELGQVQIRIGGLVVQVFDEAAISRFDQEGDTVYIVFEFGENSQVHQLCVEVEMDEESNSAQHESKEDRFDHIKQGSKVEFHWVLFNTKDMKQAMTNWGVLEKAKPHKKM
jgi:hypothetical protein